jgi:SPW repeat
MEEMIMDSKMSLKRWQDWGNLLIGAWLFISTWVMPYPSGMPNATWNAQVLGAAIVIFAACAVYMPRVWEEGINTVLGLWMIISPWVLQFSSSRAVTTNAIIVGLLVTTFAVWAMVRDKKVEKWLVEHHMLR